MKIQFHDINGNTLNAGDWCAVSHSRNNGNSQAGTRKLLTFYVQVEILEGGRLQPFDNFTFDQIHKVDFENIPESAIKSEAGYYVVYKGEEAETEEKRDQYIMSYMGFNSNRKFYSITNI